MTENLVADMGLDNVPSGVPDGTYKGHIVDAKFVKNVKRRNNPNPGKAFIFKYKIDMPEGIEWRGEKIQVDGMTVDDFYPANGADDDLFLRQKLRNTLETLGLDITNITPEDLNSVVGRPIWFKTKQNGNFTNVTDLKVADAEDVTVAASAQRDVTDF